MLDLLLLYLLQLSKLYCC